MSKKFRRTPVVYYEDDLLHEARTAVEECPMNQSEVGDLLGVSRQAVNKALRDPREQLTKLRLRIIEVLGHKRLKGPAYIWDRSEPTKNNQ